ncbi:MAG: YeeE/YedE family protein, partial [Hyphomicrobiaceae bacterium]
MEDWPTTVIVAFAGVVGGVVLGLAARLGRFCTLAAIEDAMFANDLRRLRMWALALAISIAGVAILSTADVVNFSQSLYHRLPPNPVAWILGGLMFGIGMAFCGTCGYGTLARIGGGDLRALFGFLVLGIAAYMAIAGPTAQLRLYVLSPLAFGDSSAAHTFLQVAAVGQLTSILLPLAIAVCLCAWSLSHSTFRKSTRHVFWGSAVGIAILSGWLATGWLGADPFEPQPVVSHTFSVPLGQTLIFFMTMSSATVSFGIGGT